LRKKVWGGCPKKQGTEGERSTPQLKVVRVQKGGYGGVRQGVTKETPREVCRRYLEMFTRRKGNMGKKVIIGLAWGGENTHGVRGWKGLKK